MMRVVAATLAMLIATPVLAADPVAPSAPAAPAPAAPAKFTLDTPIETIAADPAGKAALDAAVPGLTTHAMYDQFKGMSLTQLAPMSGGKLSDEVLAKVKTALAAVN